MNLSYIKALPEIYVKVFFEKIVNTIWWLFLGHEDKIVLNVWLRHCGGKLQSTNLGDDLNWAIVKYLSRKKIITYRYSFVSCFHPENFMCIGSIVDTLTNKDSIIWGSGAMYGDTERSVPLPKKVCAVRGPKTRNYLLSRGIDCPEVYGDPAVLLPLLYSTKKEKKYKIGLIPHIADLNNSNVVDFINSNSKEITLIDIRHYKNWKNLVDQINECEIIASSSLHGIIIADVYNIPNVWIKLSNKIKGDGFKFLDYFEGCGRVVKQPIDFSFSEIEKEVLLRMTACYTPPTYDIKALLRTCPFLSSSVKLELKEKGVFD